MTWWQELQKKKDEKYIREWLNLFCELLTIQLQNGIM